ncbi:MAG: helix-turn-helix transcriptional regulator [Christensenellales bacterium]|jgi:DNA-binding Xre family transcriptional regulator
MITYAPFWKTIKEKGESTYTLIEKHGISSATIDRLRKNKGISTAKINDLCRILDCSVSEVLEYIPDDN